jgi:hypothetical protein
VQRQPKPPKFSGHLAEPIVIEPQSGLIADEFNEDLNRRLGEKFRLLLEHYDIKPSDKNMWQKLSMRLIHDFVDGTKIIERTSPPKPGPKGGRRVWTDVLIERLVTSVDKILTVRRRKSPTGHKTKNKIYDAIYELLLADPFWDHFKGHERSLVTRYHEAKRRIKKGELIARCPTNTESTWVMRRIRKSSEEKAQLA